LSKGTQKSDTSLIESIGRVGWDDLKIFLAVASAGSFKRASESLGLSVNTVRNHIDRLEDVMGSALLKRSHQGVEQTELGQRLVEIAKEMASATHGLGAARNPKNGVSDRVLFSVTEGIGTFWMVPRLADFHVRHPEIRINLNCTMEPVHQFEQDNSIALQLVRPEDPNAVCVRLGTLHLMPFVSPTYLQEHGTPENLVDVRNHRLVVQTGEQLNNTILSSLFGERPPSSLIALETNSSAAHYWAIAKGIGIGMLPTYGRAITRTVVPLDIDFLLRRDIWLSYPINALEDRSVKTVLDWIKQSFDPVKYPWFADEFIHPDRFDEEFEGTNVVRLFAGFMDLPSKIA
jgi:DNA-binding transcriptional LysR family regulator